MAWVRLEGKTAQHPKILALPRKDRWTWVEVLMYCVEHQTGGHIPDGITDALPHATAAFLKQAETVGLFENNGSGLYIHDFADYNSPRADARLRKQRQRERET